MRIRPSRARLIALVGLTVFYYLIPNARVDFSRFNCNDSEMYVALAYGLVHGLGYTASMIPGQYVPHIWWPPGMPVLIAPAVALTGSPVNWLVLKLTIATIGILGVVFAWILTKRLTHDDLSADLAALFLGLNVWYWDFSHQVMAEVPVTVWILGSLILIDRLWAARRLRIAEAFVTGVCCGAGMLIKAHAVGVLVAPLAYFSAPRRNDRPRIFALVCYAVFALGFVLPSILWTARNQGVRAAGFTGLTQTEGLRRVDPMDASSRSLTVTETVGIIVQNIRTYVIYNIPSQIFPGLWPQAMLEWRGSGFVALTLTAVAVLICWPRSQVNSIHLSVVPMALINLIFVAGGAARYWLPVSSLLLIVVAMRLGNALRSRRQTYPSTRAVAVVVLTLNLLPYIYQHERHPYNSEGPWKELAELFDKVRVGNPSPVIGVRTQNPQAFQLSSGLPAPVAQGASYDYVIVRTDSSDVQPPADAVPVAEVRPWVLFRLAQPLVIGRAVTMPDR